MEEKNVKLTNNSTTEVMINKWETNKRTSSKIQQKHIRGPIEWVGDQLTGWGLGRVLPEAKLENKTILFFEIF